MAHTQLALKTNAYYRITFDYIAKAFRLHYTEGKITTFQHALWRQRMVDTEVKIPETKKSFDVQGFVQ